MLTPTRKSESQAQPAFAIPPAGWPSTPFYPVPQFAGNPFSYPPNNCYPYPVSPNPGPSFPFNTFPPSPWGFPASHSPTKSPKKINLNAPVSDDLNLKAWCEKHSLSQQDYEGLKKLGFCVGETQALTSLELSTWVWAGIPPLRRARILEICAVEKATVI